MGCLNRACRLGGRCSGKDGGCGAALRGTVCRAIKACCRHLSSTSCDELTSLHEKSSHKRVQDFTLPHLSKEVLKTQFVHMDPGPAGALKAWIVIDPIHMAHL